MDAQLSPHFVVEKRIHPDEHGCANRTLNVPGIDLCRDGVATSAVDEIDLLRSYEYGLLAAVLLRAPGRDLLTRIAGLAGDITPLGGAHTALAEAAAGTQTDTLQREFFDLFIGVGRGELQPYASYYLTGFLNERPLMRVRDDLAKIGLERSGTVHEPEDHIGLLCEIMAGLTSGLFEVPSNAHRAFFERHLKPWAMRFFTDLETSRSARFYCRVGTLGRLFMHVEAEAFDMDE
jgi:TorA maturation chaperone TorD